MEIEALCDPGGPVAEPFEDNFDRNARLEGSNRLPITPGLIIDAHLESELGRESRVFTRKTPHFAARVKGRSRNASFAQLVWRWP